MVVKNFSRQLDIHIPLWLQESVLFPDLYKGVIRPSDQVLGNPTNNEFSRDAPEFLKCQLL